MGTISKRNSKYTPKFHLIPTNMILFVSVAQLVASMSDVGVVAVLGSNLARGKIFTASCGSADSLYPSV